MAAEPRAKPLYQVFRTRRGKYLYDTATNQILRIGGHLARVLERSRLTAGDLRDLRAGIRGGLLFPLSGSPLKPVLTPDQVRKRLRTGCEQVILEVTRQCNLRCRYCPYTAGRGGRRAHGPERMDVATALGAVDLLAGRSLPGAEVAVGFYGGEPLLALDLVRRVAAYARRALGDRKLAITVTTNGTLLDEESWDFLAGERFFTLVSLDGPADRNDAWRVRADGRSGSYADVRAALEAIRARHPAYFRQRVSLSVVAAPGADLVRLQEWLLETGVRSASISVAVGFGAFLEKEYRRHPLTGEPEIRRSFIEAARAGRLRRGCDRPEHMVARWLYATPLARLAQRKFPASPADRHAHLGVCVPGARKLFVDARGDLYPCEKVDGCRHLHLGTVSGGLDEDKAVRVVNDFYEFMLEGCSRCWLQRICPACYLMPTRRHGYSRRQREAACASLRRDALDALVLYGSILESAPGALEGFRTIGLDEA